MMPQASKHPTTKDLTEAFSVIGLEEGDIVYLSTQLYGMGPLADAPSRLEYLDAIFSALYSVIGARGTLVVPTFTQQVGRFGVPFVLEQTESLTGIFGEYIRMRPDSIRSLHPVFSIASVGACSREICTNISPVAFGADSAFDRMVRMKAKAVCLGFDYYSGHITSLMHLVETAFAVPYYYNKLICSPVFSSGALIERPYVINVKYLDLECSFDFKRYIDTLAGAGALRSANIGRGKVHAVDAAVMFDMGVELLKRDIYAFLAHPPRFRKGEIPMDGPSGSEDALNVRNLAGSQLL